MITFTATTSATQRAVWTSADGLATAAVTLSSQTDDRGARGWAYELSVSVPEGVGFHYTFAKPAELIYTPMMPTAVEVLATLASFVGAWSEALGASYSDNADMFPVACISFADGYAEEFACDTYTD